ncbi:MAG: cyclophilin-like fold protein [Archaeoglobaceae archaeon]
MRLRFRFESAECIAEIYADLAPKTFEAIRKKLPLESIVRRWGDEIYFETKISFFEEENSKEIVEIGDVAYWIPGQAICLFFGKTPISKDFIRPASAVNVIGKIVKGIEGLKKVKEGETVFVEEIK